MTEYYINDCVAIPVSLLRDHGVFKGNTKGEMSWGKCSVAFQYHGEVLTLSYMYNGELRSPSFKITERPTNLGIGSRVFVECPETGKLCTKLYITPRGETKTRPMMKGTRYSEQDDSRYKRVLNTARRYDVDRRKRYGKMYYRGKLTPYGARVIKADERADESSLAWFAYVMEHRWR